MYIVWTHMHLCALSHRVGSYLLHTLFTFGDLYFLFVSTLQVFVHSLTEVEVLTLHPHAIQGANNERYVYPLRLFSREGDGAWRICTLFAHARRCRKRNHIVIPAITN